MWTRLCVSTRPQVDKKNDFYLTEEKEKLSGGEFQR